jgi:hypothetical protein
MTDTTIAKFSKCTLYRSSAFGYTRIECREATLMHGPFAQHADVSKIRFIRKGCRSPECFIVDSGHAVILEGHGHPELTTVWHTTLSGHHETRHCLYSPEWDREFDAALAVYVSETGAKVLADTARMP